MRRLFHGSILNLSGLGAASALLLSGVPGWSGAAMAQGIETQTVLHSSPRPSERDAPVALVATVTTDLGQPEGRARFFEGSTALGGAPFVPFAPGQGALALGASHSCALDSIGGVRCMGRNIRGELGDGTTEQRVTPVRVEGLSHGVIALAAGDYHTCALKITGGVMCWGDGRNGQLGNGISVSGYQSMTPVQVSGLESGVVAITAGANRSCAITAAGAAMCWGLGALGRSDLGPLPQSDVPVSVMGMERGVIDIASGSSHVCALRRNGRAFCWGQNQHGQLGNGTTEHSFLPVRVRRLPVEITALAAGGRHNCALSAEGAVRCWGDGDWGQLGQGAFEDSLLPVRVRRLQSGVTAISAGSANSCAILDGGELRCWGHNTNGNLGIGIKGHSTDRNRPVRTKRMRSGTVAVSIGGSHSCALKADGRYWCWGLGRNGQLGFGELDPPSPYLDDNIRTIPVRMRGSAFGPVEGISMATFLTDPLSRGRYEFRARYLGSDIHARSGSNVLYHRVTN